MLATPMRPVDVARGEIAWALLRGGFYSAAFLVRDGRRWGWSRRGGRCWRCPAALLIGFAFAGVGMALTTYMRSWQDFEYVKLAIDADVPVLGDVLPGRRRYPDALRWVVELTPLYHGVVLCRELTTGAVTWASLVSVVYLVAMGMVGLTVASRRLDKLLLT